MVTVISLLKKKFQKCPTRNLKIDLDGSDASNIYSKL